MRETAAFLRVGVVSAPTVDTPPAFESRLLPIVFKILLTYLLGRLFCHSKSAEGLTTFFCGVTISKHIFNIALHTFIFSSMSLGTNILQTSEPSSEWILFE